MGSDIIVVKRNRRRAFALLWAAPAWLRGIAMGARTLLGASETAPAGARNASGRNLHLDQNASFRIPTLSRTAEGHHACTGCQRCVEVCPSRCLEVEGVSESAGGNGVDRFQLDLARCIGCGDCVAVCPESALLSALPSAPRSTPRSTPLSSLLSPPLSSPLSEVAGSGLYALVSGDARLRRDLLTEGVIS